MLRITFAATLALVFALASSAVDRAEARTRRSAAPAPICDNVDLMRPCPGAAISARPARRSGSVKRGGRSKGVVVPRPRPEALQASPAGLVAPLAAKVAEIQAECGSVLTPHGGVRQTLVKYTRRVSLHWTGRAADMAGNPSCIYRRLQGWAGGYSTDYSAVGHVHISWDPERGREWGVRFTHFRPRHARRHRLARVER